MNPTMGILVRSLPAIPIAIDLMFRAFLLLGPEAQTIISQASKLKDQINMLRNTFIGFLKWTASIVG